MGSSVPGFFCSHNVLFIHTLCCVYRFFIPFYFCVEYTVWVYYSLSIHLLVDIGFFPIWDIMNKISTKNQVQVFVYLQVLIPFRELLKNGTYGL